MKSTLAWMQLAGSVFHNIKRHVYGTNVFGKVRTKGNESKIVKNKAKVLVDIPGSLPKFSLKSGEIVKIVGHPFTFKIPRDSHPWGLIDSEPHVLARTRTFSKRIPLSSIKYI